METGSSLRRDQPRMSDSLSAWFTRFRFGTRAQVFGFIHCTFSLCGNCGTMCFPELTITAAERGRVVWVLPSSNCKASLLEALRKTLGKSLVPGSILNLCLISLPSHVKLTTGLFVGCFIDAATGVVSF